MLRTPISKKNSIRVITLIIAVVLLATIWPLRLYHERKSFIGGKVTEISDLVTNEEDAGEYFTAQYDHLESIEVYIESVEEGDYFTARLFDQSTGENTQLAVEKIPFPKDDLPDYVTIPIDVDLVPGNVYVLVLSGQVRKMDPSTFRVGFESAEAAAADPNAPVYNVAFHHDTGISGLALAMRTHYDEPLTKAKSALAGGIVILLTILALTIQKLWFRRFPRSECLVPLLTVLQYALTPVIIVAGGFLAICVFPLRLFDSRVMDVLLYEFGIIAAMLFLLYGLWHDRIGTTERFESMTDILAHTREILMVIIIALIVRSACTYMNAVNDYVHRDCEAQIVIGLVCLILLLGKLRQAVNPWTVLTVIAAAVLGVRHVRGVEAALISEGGHELAEKMANTISRTVAAGFLAVAAVSVLVMVVEVLREHRAAAMRVERRERAAVAGAGRREPAAARVLLVVFGLFLVLTVLFRNGRTWMLVLAAVSVLLYVRYAFSEMRQRSGAWLTIISYGILLHFACNVVWTMVHRYYLAYNYSRFSMQFHTVTVTAYYLLIVSAAALSLFLMKYRQFCDLPFRARIRRMWKEIGFLGAVCSYMVMSMTRAGVYSLAIMVLVGISCACAGMPHVIRRMGRTLGTIVLIAVLTFPSMFTGQRLISTMVADPVIYAPVESYFDVLMRHTPWNSTEFMNLEIFFRDSLDRLVGGGIGSQIYYRLRWNVPQGYSTAMLDVDGVSEGTILAAGTSVADGTSTVVRNDLVEAMDQGAGKVDRLPDYDADGNLLSGTAAYRSRESIAERLMNLRYGITEGPLVAAVSDEIIAGITTGNYTGSGFSNGRTDIWRAYLAEMNLTGHEGMDLTLPDGEIAIHAHNILIQMAYDCGIPAGIVFGILLVVALARSGLYYRKHRYDAASLMPLLAMTGYLMTGMVEWIYHLDNPYTIVFLLILAPLMFPEQS